MPIPFFSIGFRAFFASGILFAAIALSVWAEFWQLDIQQTSESIMAPVGGMLFWHPHELIMGFALAIIMGFLLTAVRNWTGLETAPPLALFGIWLSWVAARIIMAFGDGYPFTIILISQFLPVLLTAVFIAIPIIEKRMWRNLFAPLSLLIFALIDAHILYAIHFKQTFNSGAFYSQIFLLMFIISMIGGRIIPFFTANKLGIKKWEEPKVSLLSSVLPLLILVIAHLIYEPSKISALTSAVSILLFITHSVRLIKWHHPKIWGHPLLWSLWVSYAFLPLGFLLLSMQEMYSLGSVPLHVMAVGTLCGLIVSMVARVSLGHTGRPIQHDILITGVISCMILAMLVRTLAIMVMGYSSTLIIISALLASFSFAVLFIRFIYIWLTPRPDQQ